MGRLILYVLGVALLVAVAVWLANDPGDVHLAWHGWRVDTSVGVLVAAVIVLVAAILFIVKLAGIVGAAMRALAAKRREQRLNRGLTSLGDGFAAVAAGQASAARRLAREAASLLKDNSAVLVLRKEAAALNGNIKGVDAAAREMLERPETELAGLRTLATNALVAGDAVSAADYARRAWARRDPPGWALTLLLDLDISRERWDDALALIGSREARQAFTPAEHAALKSNIYVRVSAAALAHNNTTEAAVAAKRAMSVGGPQSRAAVVAFANAMAAQGKGAKAADAVERAWADQPHADLLVAYRGLVPGETAIAWAQRVEGLAKAAPDHPESRLAVAAAALNAELWGQARNRLSGLTAQHMTPDVRARAARMLAELESRQRGDADAAADWLKVALEFQDASAKKPQAPRTVAELLAG